MTVRYPALSIKDIKGERVTGGNRRRNLPFTTNNLTSFPAFFRLSTKAWAYSRGYTDDDSD